MSRPIVAAAVPDAETAVTPSFIVGPDVAGRWLAIEIHGLGGGYFVSREAALGYARSESGRRPGGVEILSALSFGSGSGL